MALRERIVSAYKRSKFTYAQIADLFDVGEASVSRLLRLDRESGGDLRPDAHGGGCPRRIPAEQFDALRVLVSEIPDATRVDLCEIWEERFGVRMSKATMGRIMQEAGLTRKKSNSQQSNNSAPTLSRSADRFHRG